MARKSILEVPAKGAIFPGDYIGQVVRIPTKHVKPLPGQPRTFFDKTAMQRLQTSIEEIGQQQPATVIPWEDGTFRLRDGERRFRCCVAIRIPLLAFVEEPKSAEEEFELSTVANLNRESHSPLEKALAMKRLRDGPLKRSALEIARTFGVSDQTVYNHLLFLDALPQRIIDLMDPNKQGERKRTLQASAAVRLTALKDYPNEQLMLAQRIVRENLSLGQAMRLIDAFADKKKIATGRGRERKASDHLQLLQSGIRQLQTKVKYFNVQEPRWFDELFHYMPVSRYDDVREQIEETIDALERLREKVADVENVGAKRGAA